MQVQPTEYAQGQTQSPAASSDQAPQTKAETDFQTFLSLLTAQMRHQDPLKPLDSTQFVAQLAAFSSVEQQIETNAKLDDLISAVAPEEGDSGSDETASEYI